MPKQNPIFIVAIIILLFSVATCTARLDPSLVTAQKEVTSILPADQVNFALLSSLYST